MINIHLTKSIATTPERVIFELLQHETLDRFFNAKFRLVQDAEPGERTGGKGAIREVRMGGQTFQEQIVSADDKQIVYKIIGKGPVSEHQGEIRVNALDDKSSVVDYQIVCKGPKFVPNILVKWVIEKDIRQAINKFARYFDER